MKQLFLAVAGLFLINLSVVAQSDKEDIDLIQSVYGKDKKALVSAYMNVQAKDSAAFWKLYDEYEDKRKALSRERIDLIKKYADNYSTLSDATATELAKGSFANDAQSVKLHESYFSKFSAIIGGKNSAKLFQLETYLQNAVRGVVMDQIPFIGELDRSKKP